jgi:hypothetical protein
MCELNLILKVTDTKKFKIYYSLVQNDKYL